MKNGKGTYTWANGNSYTGDFVNDERTGQGTFTWANGDRYEGGFVNGKLQGQGTYTWAAADGAQPRVYTGYFKDGLINPEP